MSSIDPNRLEQEAAKLLQQGKIADAIDRYQAILRATPRDRRIKQRVAELLLQAGRAGEAERHFRELAQSLATGGQERGAIPIYKQLLKIKGDDPSLHEALGDCHLAVGSAVEARQAWERAVELTARVQPDRAVPVQEKLCKLSPGDFPSRVRLAELVEAARWGDRAAVEWSRLAADAVRHGRPEERARFLELSLRQRESRAVLLDAAEARLALGEPSAALAHLQKAAAAGAADGRLLGLLGRALAEAGDAPRAGAVWLEAARVRGEEGDAAGRAEALRQALACGVSDAGTRAALDAAEADAARRALRLDQLEWARALDEVCGPVFVRAELLRRYGFADRARAALEQAPSPARERIAVRVLLAELWAEAGEPAAAVAELRRVLPPDDVAADALAARLRVLEDAVRAGGAPPEDDEELPTDPGPAEDDALIDDGDDAPADDDSLVDEGDDGADSAADGDVFDDEPPPDEPPADPAADEEERAERLWAIGEADAAIDALKAALRLDPGRPTALERLGEWMAARRAPPRAAAPPPPPLAVPEDPFRFDDAPDFSDILGPAPAAVGAGAAAVDDALSLLAVHALDEALRRLGAAEGLGAARVRAAVAVRQGRAPEALSVLRDAVDESASDDPHAAEARIELAALFAAQGKPKLAARTLDDAESLPAPPPAAVLQRLRRGISLLG